MKNAFLWLSLCGLLLTGAACKERHLTDAPNLLLITIDTARADYFGCYGSPDVSTPHIDRLAAAGVRFGRNVAPSQCTNLAQPIDGRNLTPMFSNPHYRNHEYVISEAVNGVIRAIYREGYKFMKPYPTDWALKQSRLYRAWDDYGESRDLKDQEPARARQLEAALEEWLKRAKSMALPSQQPRKLDPKTRKALKTLGYID